MSGEYQGEGTMTRMPDGSIKGSDGSSYHQKGDASEKTSTATTPQTDSSTTPKEDTGGK